MLNEATRLFALAHADDDVRQLALRGCNDSDVDLPLALQQIQGRQTARRKLPSWAALDGILYPPHLNMEQCSSEQTARYKAAVCRRLLSAGVSAGMPSSVSSGMPASMPSGVSVSGGFPAGKSVPPSSLLFDLTGGFGVDFAFMSEAFDEAIYVERDPALFAIASANMRLLAPHARCINDDALAVLSSILAPPTSHLAPRTSFLIPHSSFLIYLDPARRDAHGDRTYGIADCTPNVLAIKDELLAKADYVMLKLSPMLDWRKAVHDLGKQHVTEVHIISVHNECKELLIVMRQQMDDTQTQAASELPHLYCVNDDEIFTVHNSQFTVHNSQFSIHNSPLSPLPPLPTVFRRVLPPPSSYLYEPNASIMKAGCFAAVEQAFGVRQLAPNSHLFVSEERVEQFPGRAFQVTAVTSMNKKELKTALQGITQANLTVRNFPLSVAELRKKLRLTDGGDTYIFATTLSDGKKVLIICNPAPR